MRIVLLGPPGSGKGTQAKRVAGHYGIPHVTASSALADIAREDSELGRLVRETIEVNRVSDDLLAAALRVRLSQADAATGFVLDGFPRTVPQAETLEAVLDGIGRPVDVVILIDVDPDELMERLVGRLTCEGCGALYNAYANPPTVDGVCDRCGGRVSRRPDDYEETIGNRLRIFESQTAQLIQHFKLRGKLRRVSGEGEPEKVFADIRHIVDSTPRTVIEMEPVSERAEPISVLPSGLPLPGARKRPKAPARQDAAKPAPAAPPPVASAPGKAKAVAKAAPAAPAPKAPAGASKPVAGKPVAGKAPAKPATQAGAKALPAKKVEARPAAAKKVEAKPVAAKKAPPRKPAVKKAPAKAAAGKPAAKKAASRPAPKASAAKSAATKKPVAKKPASRKPVAKKPAVKKPAARKAVAKPATRKVPAKKAAPKKSAARKAAAKKAAVAQPAKARRR
ncbi:MAG: nucleoside monophosphate kinase [Gammaproteobacteria bacterium]|jgi:adenylate kinase|nr:nucleoside monophosphate kinase [Gammaproteobacteria bacterium]